MNKSLWTGLGVAACLFASLPAAAQAASTESATGAPAAADTTMGLHPGFWLRGGVGFDGTNTLHLIAPGGGPDTTLTFTGATALDLGIGYAPAHWIAVGAVGSINDASLNVKTGGLSTNTELTYLSPMLGARIYPFRSLGLNVGVGGGWSWALADAAGLPSSTSGPAWSASIGFDDRILSSRSWLGNKHSGMSLLGERLWGVSLRFDDSPALKGSNWTGSAWDLSVMLTATL